MGAPASCRTHRLLTPRPRPTRRRAKASSCARSSFTLRDAGRQSPYPPEAVMGIVRFALRWPYTFYVLAILILFLGVTAFRAMPTDIFPEIDIPVVTVIWQYTGLDTPEMEQRVTTY